MDSPGSFACGQFVVKPAAQGKVIKVAAEARVSNTSQVGAITEVTVRGPRNNTLPGVSDKSRQPSTMRI
jgi:hypothetical protein